ncbi:hypothetical protein [Brumicola pallidula]|uniref:Uncharacterized protein n=1 Tax=Brumicola pallidula DSM 14239 = ACAM 615 TaxID=1121922 RepID=K6Y743_9ALTE|nr:hypothetical protein [Glaciecola pallidula]GAC28604.1 hypothetical protein GPAL_1741 [Glaciecola pallidula DSM 14239 = ACAM 615]
MFRENEYLFIQYRLNEHRDSFINGELRITQQQYYRHLKSAVSDSFEGQQLMHANGKKFTLFGNHSTYIWSCSVTDQEGLSNLKKFDDYNLGLLILEPEVFANKVCSSLACNPILKNIAEINLKPVVYTNKEIPMAEDKKNPLSRWTKPMRFSHEREYRLCVHNVPPMQWLAKHIPEDLYRIEEVYTPNEYVKTK